MAFKQIKNEIFRAPILAYYNPKKETTLQTDVSIKELGPCLLQDQKPVYFASKCTHRYPTEDMLLQKLNHWAVAWVMEKFYHFLYVNHFILEMDQKPLEAILSKSLNQATSRLQRILKRTFLYNFTMCYIPGGNKSICWIACLKWEIKKTPLDYLKLQVNQITQQLPAWNDTLQQLRMATQTDDELAILKHTIMQGWPKTIKQVPPMLHPY